MGAVTPFLRKASHTKGPMVIAAISYWAVGLPASYVLGFPMGLGGAGIWWGLVIGLAVASVLLSWRFWGLKLREGGELNDTLMKMLELNVRVPRVFLGDLGAQIAACTVGARRLGEVAARYRHNHTRAMFAELLDRIKHDVVRILARVKIQTEEDVAAVAPQRRAESDMQFRHPGVAAPQAAAPAGAAPGQQAPAGAAATAQAAQPFVRDGRKVGRNDACPCGSGKKFKHCHGA